MSDNEPTVKYNAELSKSAYVPTAVNVHRLTRAQGDIARLCTRIAVDEVLAFQVWCALDEAGFFGE